MGTLTRSGGNTSTLSYALPRMDGGVARVLDGPQQGLEVRIVDAPIVIGTDEACSLVLTDRKVSRRHCSISAGLRGFAVKDLGSRNGTLFERSRVVEMIVPPGAIIQVGTTHVAIAAGGDGFTLPPARRTSFGRLVGASPAMRRLFALLERAASSDATVLLGGETGVGKELAAEALHRLGPRAQAPLVVFDCSAVAGPLLASELFGHARGAFSGAAGDRIGAVEQADGGTLFLDEIGELPLALQAAFLRLCDRKTVTRVGETAERTVDVRLIAATRRNLAAEVLAGTFREDLYYRLQVLPITLPPLRARLADMPAIVDTMLRDLGVAQPGPVEGPNLDRLLAYPWPGNLRELRNTLERALIAAGRPAPFVELQLDVEPRQAAPASGGTFSEQRKAALDQFEREFLERLMADSGGKLRTAARTSGIERTQLKRMLRKHGLG